MIKPGDKVISIDGSMEGVAVYSSNGISITGWIKVEDGERAHFQTLGEPPEEVAKYWRKI